MPAHHNPAAPDIRSRWAVALLCCALLQAQGCTLLRPARLSTQQEIGSTYQKHLARAEMGDPESQNAVGFMLYHGEGVARDRGAARSWFEQAARGGNERARRNLAAMNAAPPTLATRAIAARPLADVAYTGEHLFAKYCGGCHGFNGIAYYQHAPSFALGERLEKSDGELMRSLRNGHANMPSWEDKLPMDQLALILAAVRALPERYAAGIDASMSGRPDFYYVFGPMEWQQ